MPLPVASYVLKWTMLRREFLKQSLAITATLSGIALTDGAQSAADSLTSALSDIRPTLPNLNHLTGHVILRGDPDYEAARIGRNTNVGSFPAVIVFCSHTSDVERGLNWARNHAIPFRVRCGRHSYEGY